MAKKRKHSDFDLLYDQFLTGKYDDAFKKRLDTNVFEQKTYEDDKIDLSNRDYLVGDENPYRYDGGLDLSQRDPFNEIRANNQGGWDQAGKGVLRATSKALTEVAKLPAVLGGLGLAIVENTSDLISGKDDHSFLDTAFNNAWVKAIDGLHESVTDGLLPIYTTKAVREGSLAENVFSTSFWATDGADGLGFVVAMMVPGAIFEYAALGGKLLKGLRVAGGKAGMVAKTEKAVSVLKGMGITGKTIDSGLAVFGNTLFEAGAEAKGAGDSLEAKKPEFIENYKSTQDYQDRVISRLAELDEERRGGKITIEEYNSMSANAGVDVAEGFFEEQRALAMRNTFMSNVGILLGPNAIMHKAIWGKAAQKYTKIPEKGIDAFSLRAQKFASRWGTAIGSEALWEEGSQTTVENLNVDRAMRGEQKDGSFLKPLTEPFLGQLDRNGEYAKEYIKTLNTTEGQKAIFLGAALGGPMMSTQGRIEDVRNRERTNSVIDGVSKSVDNFNTIFDTDIYLKEKNADGSESYVYKKDKNGNPTAEREIDKEEVFKVIEAMNLTEEESEMFDMATALGYTEVAEKLKQKAILNLVMPAIHNGEIGLKVLEQKLKEDSKFLEILERDQTADQKDSSKAFISEVLETAKYLQAENEKFKDFSSDLITLEHEEATAKDKESFLNKLNVSYLNVKNQLRESKKNLNSLKEKRKDIYDELGVDPLYDANSEFPTGAMKSGLIDDLDLLARAEKTKAALENNDLLRKADKDYSEKKKEVEKLEKDIADIWYGKDLIEKSFNDYMSGIEARRAEFAKEEEINDILSAIDNATTLDELKDIDSDNPEVKKRLNAKRSILRASKQASNNNTKASNSNNNNRKKTAITDEFDFITELFEEGDAIALSDENNYFGLNESKVRDKEFLVDSIDREEKKVVIKEDGGTAKFTISFETIAKNLGNSPDANFSTEGGLIHTPASSETIESNSARKHDSVDAEIVNINPATNERYPWISQSAEEYERNPRDKSGDIVEFDIDFDRDTSNYTDEWLRALEMVKNNDFSKIDFLIKHLPIDVVFQNSGRASLETYRSDTKDKFNRTTYNLRKTIILEMSNGTNIKSLSTTIAGQLNGTLQIEGSVIENSIADLHEFSGDMSKVKTDDIYMVDDNGNLVNGKGRKWGVSRRLAKGELYLKISTANGTPFPLKLNVAKINESQAEALYELYKYRFEDIKAKGKSTLLINTPQEVQDLVKEKLVKELELFDKNGMQFNNLTIKDVIDFLIWDGTTSPKSQVRFYGGELLVAGMSFSQEDFDSQESKDLFINTLTSQEPKSGKRQHVRFKDKAGGIKSLTVDNPNRLYLEYLIENRVLNTNAKVDGPTFKNKTSIYLNTGEVKANGTISEHNTSVSRNKFKSVVGVITNKTKSRFHKIFKKGLKLPDEDGNAYTDNKGVEYDRVSSLKQGSKPPNNEAVRNSKKRGRMIDRVFRDFFMDSKFHNLEEFINMFEQHLKDVNKESASTSAMDMEFDLPVIIKMFDSLNVIAQDFLDRGWTVYSHGFTVGGQVGYKRGKNNGRYAGTTDFLATNKQGEIIIIDLKTSSQDRYEAHEDPDNDKYGYKESDTIQLNSYRELMTQMDPSFIFGGMYILPLQIVADKGSDGSSYTKTDNFYDLRDDLLIEVDEESLEDLLGLTEDELKKPATVKKTASGAFVSADPNAAGGTQFDIGGLLNLVPGRGVPSTAAPTKGTKSPSSTKQDWQFKLLQAAGSNRDDMMAMFDQKFEEVTVKIGKDTATYRTHINPKDPSLSSFYIKKTKTGGWTFDITMEELEALNALFDPEVFKASIKPSLVWKNRLASENKSGNISNTQKKSVPLQKVTKTAPVKTVSRARTPKAAKPSEVFDFNSMTEKNAESNLKKLVAVYQRTNRSIFNEMQKMLLKNASSGTKFKDALKMVVDSLVDSNITIEELNEKCK
jgi:hypothetical protein